MVRIRLPPAASQQTFIPLEMTLVEGAVSPLRTRLLSLPVWRPTFHPERKRGLAVRRQGRRRHSLRCTIVDPTEIILRDLYIAIDAQLSLQTPPLITLFNCTYRR